MNHFLVCENPRWVDAGGRASALEQVRDAGESEVSSARERCGLRG
jgi:hypothetical protein